MQPPLSRHRIFNLLNIVVALSFAGALFYAWTALASQQSLASESAQESRTNTPDSENKPHDEAAEFAERNSNDSLSISWTPKVSPTRTSLLASSSARSSSTPTHSGTAGHKYEPEYYMQYKSPDVEPKKSGASRTCLPTDLSPSSGLVNGKWTLSGLVGGELSRNESNFPQFQYSSNGCEIRRVGVEEARSCLRNKHIVLLGDSLTRQLFGSLIIFLETGKPGLRYKDKHDPAMPGWLESAQDSSEAALGCGSSFLRCDGNGPFFNKPENGEESNRYYINPKHNLKVTFLGYYAAGCGREPVRLRAWPS